MQSDQAPNGAGQPLATRTVFDTFRTPQEAPYEVGQLAVHPTGDLETREEAYPVAFEFVYRGVPFHADIKSDPEEPLSLRASVGVIPYSAETALGRQMAAQFAALARPQRGRFTLEPGGRIALAFEAVIPRPRTPVTVLATVTSLLVEIRPYLDILEAARALRVR
jgi:hypothetical protein